MQYRTVSSVVLFAICFSRVAKVRKKRIKFTYTSSTLKVIVIFVVVIDIVFVTVVVTVLRKELSTSRTEAT